MILRTLALVTSFLICAPAGAMVGRAAPAGETGRPVVLLVGSRGTSCTGVILARDLILTAAHCVLPGADYKLVEFDAAGKPALKAVAAIARHPQFDVNAVLRHQVTADVALLKLSEPMKRPAALLAAAGAMVAVGDRFLVIGFGVATPGDGKSGGTARLAELVATGQPGTLQIRLVDPATKGESPGLGACTGDSGAPVFRELDGKLAIVGVVSWSTGPKNSAGCGGMTGVTPLVRYQAWITEQAKKMGSPIAP